MDLTYTSGYHFSGIQSHSNENELYITFLCNLYVTYLIMSPNRSKNKPRPLSCRNARRGIKNVAGKEDELGEETREKIQEMVVKIAVKMDPDT